MTAGIPHGSELILLAEGDESGREMVRQALINFACRALPASNGEEALPLCERETPSLAVLDEVMPHMGGAATAVELPSLGRTIRQMPDESPSQTP